MTESSNKRRPRFSLLSLVLLLTVAASVAAMFALRAGHRRELAAEAEKRRTVEVRLNESWNEARRLTDTIHDLRNQLGVIEVADRTRVYATRLRTYQDHVWKWQVYVPEGSSWQLSVFTGDVSDVGYNGGGMGIRRGLDPGEHTITLSGGVNFASASSYCVVDVDGSETRQGGGFDWLKWPSTERRTQVSTLSYKPREFAPGPVELMRFRAAKGGMRFGMGALPGFVIGIDPVTSLVSDESEGGNEAADE